MNIREHYRTKSNNKINSNQNICVQEVAKHFNTEDETRYLHKMSDLVINVRSKYTVRSRTSQVKNLTVGKARAKLQKLTLKENLKPIGYMVQVSGHALLLSTNGETIIDTDPRKKDRRTIISCYIVY